MSSNFVFVERRPKFTVCEEAGLKPSQFYTWQKQFFENSTAAFQANGRPKRDVASERITALEQKLQGPEGGSGELMTD